LHQSIFAFLFLTIFLAKTAISLQNFNRKIQKINPKKQGFPDFLILRCKLADFDFEMNRRNIFDSKSIAIPVLILKN